MTQEKCLCFELNGIKEGNSVSKDFNDFIRILLAQDQVIKIWSDGAYVCVEYDDADPNFGGLSLKWIDPYEEAASK